MNKNYRGVGNFNELVISVSGSRGLGKSTLIVVLLKFLRCLGLEVEIHVDDKRQLEVYQTYKNIDAFELDKKRWKVVLKEEL